MIVEICAGAIIIACIAAIAYLLTSTGKVKCERTNKDGKAWIKIIANKEIPKVEIIGKFGKEEIKFERKDIKKGQTIEFSYPQSSEKAKVTLYDEHGKPEVIEL